MSVDISTRLAQFREHFGFSSQAKFAKYLGIPQTSYNGIERGISPLNQPLMTTLAYKFGPGAVYWLLTGEGAIDDPISDHPGSLLDKLKLLPPSEIVEISHTLLDLLASLPPLDTSDRRLQNTV